MSTSPTVATETPQPVTPPSPRPQCRFITTSGQRCRGHVLQGLHLCYSHYHHRHPALADKDHISIPLLEDHASIQLLMTQIAHGLLSMRLEPARAKAAIWAAQVAAHTLPRPARLKGNEPTGQPVHRIGFDHDAMISADPDPTVAEPADLSSPPSALHPAPSPSPQPVTRNLGSSVPGALSPAPSNLNYLCHVPQTADEVWALQDRTHLGVNQPPPEARYTDPYHPAPPPQAFPGWDVPPPPPPPPPPAHESGLPCDCPACERHNAIVDEIKRKLTGRPRRKSASESGPEAENPLCPSNNPTCLGPQSEFCCRACRKLRPPAPPDDDFEPESEPRVPHNPALSKVAASDPAERVCPGWEDVGEQSTQPGSEPGALGPVPGNPPPGVTPGTQYPEDPIE